MKALQEMLEMQRGLQKRLGTDFSTLSDKERAQFMRDHFVYLDQELQEALYEVPYFKAWKDYSSMSADEKQRAWEKVKMELVDAWHFFMNLLLCAGFTPETFFDMYKAKNKENYRRQDAGYTSDVSYREQTVEEVMQGSGEVNTPVHLPMCKVSMDGEDTYTTDFIAVMFMQDGRASVQFNANEVAIGIAIRLLTNEYNKMLNAYDAAGKADIESTVEEIVGGAAS